MYSIVEPVQENQIDHHRYFTYVLKQLLLIDFVDEKALDVLRPWSEEILSNYRILKKQQLSETL